MEWKYMTLTIEIDDYETKKSLNKFLTTEGPTAELINWYLSDTTSRQYLEQLCEELGNMPEYSNHSSRVKYNNLYPLLRDNTDNITKVILFRGFLFSEKPIIKKLRFHRVLRIVSYVPDGPLDEIAWMPCSLPVC